MKLDNARCAQGDASVTTVAHNFAKVYQVRTVAGDEVARSLLSEDLMAFLMSTSPSFVVDVTGNKVLVYREEELDSTEMDAAVRVAEGVLQVCVCVCEFIIIYVCVCSS